MRITKSLAQDVYEAYVALFTAVENGIDSDMFFNLRDEFREIRNQILENEAEHDASQIYIEAAKSQYHRDGAVNIDDEAIVLLSDDKGAYVEAWVWVDY